MPEPRSCPTRASRGRSSGSSISSASTASMPASRSSSSRQRSAASRPSPACSRMVRDRLNGGQHDGKVVADRAPREGQLPARPFGRVVPGPRDRRLDVADGPAPAPAPTSPPPSPPSAAPPTSSPVAGASRSAPMFTSDDLLWFDFETLGRGLDLKAVGTYAYAAKRTRSYARSLSATLPRRSGTPTARSSTGSTRRAISATPSIAA